MDKLLDTVKQFADDDKKDSPSGTSKYGGSYSAGGYGSDDEDFKTAADEASNRAGNSGNSDMFASILGGLKNKKPQIADEDLDEEAAIKKHKKYYDDDDDDDEEDGSSLGSAAAMHALKLFSKGETGQKQTQGAFLGLAMSEATKLFEAKSSKGKVASGTQKEDVVQKAGEMALKMYLKSQTSGGSSGSGGAGGLMSMASKFL